MKKSGLSILEILIATLILSVSLLGLANIYVAATRKLAHSRYRMVAGELSKQWLEPLHSDVRQDVWGSNCLGSGSGCPGDIICDNIAYTPSFTFSDFDISGIQVRKVRLNISWPELL